MKCTPVILTLTGILASSAWAVPQAAETSLCDGLVRDRAARPMSALAKPALGAAMVDPEFGTTIRRISAVSPGGLDPAIRPMYSTTSAWNSDESLLILYERGTGHRLHDGLTYEFLRYLDVRPPDLEQVYWHTTHPYLLHYVDGRTMVRYHVLEARKEPLRTFEFCAGAVKADSHAFTSWDSNVLGLSCDGKVFVYDIERDAVTGIATAPLAPPMAAPSGHLFYYHGLVLDEALRVQRQLDLSEPDTHSSLGTNAAGHDVFNGAAYDPGPSGSGVGSLVSHDLTNGSSRVVVGPATGFPYPPSATHISSLAYRRTGWAFVSIVGNPAGQNLLDNELLLANVDTGEVCRLGHHRSYGKKNTKLQTPYWAEPHVVASPSGTRALFASDWGNGATVDAYVLELPPFDRKPAGLRVTLSSDKASYRLGERMSLSMGFENVGPGEGVDVYFALVPPGGKVLLFFRDWQFQAVPSNPSLPSRWPRLVTGLSRPHSFNVALDSIYQATWTSADPRGTYSFLLFATRANALADDRLDGGDLLSSGGVAVVYAR